jgi:methylated-DNA-[protein]-cysteine S-methyltransferase
MTEAFTIDRIETPLGELAVIVDARHLLRAVGFVHDHPRMESTLRVWEARPAKDPGGASTALRAYFAGELDALDSLEVHADGTDFQRRVWRALRAIPFGETRSYSDVARAIGSPAAVRAVGRANGRNPIGIVVPCHRVIGADGSLTGFGGGVELKRWLLDHETTFRALRRSA